MNSSIPVSCTPASFALLSAQVSAIESPDALLNGAVAIALHQIADADPARTDSDIQAIVDTIRQRVRGRQPQAILAHLHAYLFDELGFAGNESDCYNADNSYLPRLIETRRGLPITLSLIYKIVAGRLGLRARGVAMPGHFLAGVIVGDQLMLIDAFYGGRELSHEEAHARLRQMYGNDMEWSDHFLAPTSNRHWLTRILQNLLNSFAAAGKYMDVAAMIEMEMLLWPTETHLQRDLALVLARCGMARPAWKWLDQYLKTNPNDPQQGDLKQLLNALGG